MAELCREQDGLNPLHLAADNGSTDATECVKLLVETGRVDINAQTPDGSTAYVLQFEEQQN